MGSEYDRPHAERGCQLIEPASYPCNRLRIDRQNRKNQSRRHARLMPKFEFPAQEENSSDAQQMKEDIRQVIPGCPVVPQVVVQKQTRESDWTIEDVSVSVELAICYLRPNGAHEWLPNHTEMLEVIANKIERNCRGRRERRR